MAHFSSFTLFRYRPGGYELAESEWAKASAEMLMHLASDKASELAKKALLRKVGEHSADPDNARLETDLLKPVPAIRLAAEHTAIEYSSVIFREGNVRLWLPQTAEVFFEWNGRRVHRRHTFNNYMLFAVDEKERIANPKGSEIPAAADATEPPESRQP